MDDADPHDDPLGGTSAPVPDSGDGDAAESDESATDRPDDTDRSDGPDRPEPLAAVALTTHHAGTFVLVPLLAAHYGGVLGDLLDGVGTATGLALFALLWAVLHPATGRWLAACDPARPLTGVRAGAKYGALAGLGFLPGPVIAVGLATGEVTVAGVLFAAGLVVAPLVGAVAGVVLGVGDVLLLRGSRRLVPA